VRSRRAALPRPADPHLRPRGALRYPLKTPYLDGAALLSFDLAATVDTRGPSPANPALDLPPEFALGAAVTARIRYATIAVDTNPSPGRGVYNGVIREFAASFPRHHARS